MSENQKKKGLIPLARKENKGVFSKDERGNIEIDLSSLVSSKPEVKPEGQPNSVIDRNNNDDFGFNSFILTGIASVVITGFVMAQFLLGSNDFNQSNNKTSLVSSNKSTQISKSSQKLITDIDSIKNKLQLIALDKKDNYAYSFVHNGYLSQVSNWKIDAVNASNTKSAFDSFTLSLSGINRDECLSVVSVYSGSTFTTRITNNGHDIKNLTNEKSIFNSRVSNKNPFACKKNSNYVDLTFH